MLSYRPVNLFEQFELKSFGKIVLLSVMIGIVAGLGAIGFTWLLHQASHWLLYTIAGYVPTVPAGEPTHRPPQMFTQGWVLVATTTRGGLITGILVYGLAPEAEGHGTDGAIRAFHRLKGAIRWRVPFVKAIASAITIGSGGSAGREGPIAQIGAGFGSWIGKLLRLTSRDRRIMVLAGMSGGVGSIFRAPLGGALFSTEVLYRDADLEHEALVPCVISSITAYAVFTALLGTHTIFDTPQHIFASAWELPFYVLLGIVCAVTGWFYTRTYNGIRDLFSKRLPIPRFLKPAIGGLLLGLLALWLPQTLGGGYGTIQQAINGELALRVLIFLIIGKVIATSLTIGSGGSGGVFAPSLFIGAMLGGAFGQLAHQIAPQIITDPSAFVLVGMASFFGGIASVPLTTVIMVTEMTGSYGLLVPLMLACVTSAFIARRWGIYEEQVVHLIDSPAHLGDFAVDVLEELKVGDIPYQEIQVKSFSEDTPLPHILKEVADVPLNSFPVVNKNGELVGIFSLNTVRSMLAGDVADNLVLAIDLATPDVITITPIETLHQAMRLFTLKNIDELPVVDPDNPKKVLGMLPRKLVIATYNKKIQELKASE